MGEDFGDRLFRPITGESVFGEMHLLVTTGESVGEVVESTLKEAELGRDLDLVLWMTVVSSTSSWSSPLAELGEREEWSSSPLLQLAPEEREEEEKEEEKEEEEREKDSNSCNNG